MKIILTHQGKRNIKKNNKISNKNLLIKNSILDKTEIDKFIIYCVFCDI